jgi:SAM-dependent methyltransferase
MNTVRLTSYRRLHNSYFNHERSYLALLDGNGLLDNSRAVLSIGSGLGQLELRLARERGLELGCVEPNLQLAQAFLEQARAEGIAAYIREIHLETFQACDIRERYDLALALHSWFALGYDRRMVDKVFAALRPGGHFFLALPSLRDPIRRTLRRKPKVSAEEFSTWAGQQGLEHRFFYHHFNLAGATFLVEGEPSAAARDYVAFVGRTPWDELCCEERAAVTATLARAQRAGGLERVRGCLVIEKP